MNTNDKTLADVQPGGRVRLGDQLPPLPYPNYPVSKTGLQNNAYTASQMWDYARAALSAQPSPGGQGDVPSIDYEDLLDQAKDLIHCGCSVNGAFEWLLEQLTDGEALAARQPVGEPVAFQLAGSEPLWCLHVLGMDDVHPAPSKAHAEKAAAWHNEQFKDQAARLGISIEAKVVPWPHSAESHAAGVAEFIPQWLIPQWQLDALEAKAKAPAQAVDLRQPDPTLLSFYQVSDFPSLVTALEAHVLQLIDLRKRSVKPWEDTMPPTLLPKWVRENSPVLAKDLLALAEKWQDEAAVTWGESPAHAAKQQCCDELRALIDSQAVGK